MAKEKLSTFENLDNKKVWNTSEVGLFLGRSSGSIRNLVLRKAIPFRKLGGRLAFLPDEIIEWIQTSPGLKLSDIERE